MTLLRIRHITDEFAKLLHERLTFFDDRLRKPFIMELVNRMESNPESVFCLARFDDQYALQAFIIAIDPGPFHYHITLSQVWSHPDNEFSWYEPFFARLLLWAQALGKDHIKAETQRSTKALLRRFGFKPLSTNIIYDVKDSYVMKVLEECPGSFIDG